MVLCDPPTNDAISDPVAMAGLHCTIRVLRIAPVSSLMMSKIQPADDQDKKSAV